MDFRMMIKEFKTIFSQHLILKLLRDYKSPNDKISEILDIWSAAYFNDLMEKLKFENIPDIQ